MMIPTDGATGAKKVIFALDVPSKIEALPLIEPLASLSLKKYFGMRETKTIKAHTKTPGV